MVRFSTSTAYLAAATFLGAVALPASMDFAATRLSGSAPEQVAQASTSTTSPSAHAESAKPRSASVQRREPPTERVEERIKQLHAQLKITPDQEDKWNAFGQIMRENAQTMQQLIEQRVQNQPSMNAVDDLKSYAQIAEGHAEGVNKLVPAFEDLYNTMTPEQKKNADLVFSRFSHQMASRNGASRAHATGTPKSPTQTQ